MAEQTDRDIHIHEHVTGRTERDIRIHERVAILETNQAKTEATLEDIVAKLDSLLELKAKGMGAVGLVSLVVGSGLIGLVVLVINFFKGGGTHL
jgi:hypothetical protein